MNRLEKYYCLFKKDKNLAKNTIILTLIFTTTVTAIRLECLKTGVSKKSGKELGTGWQKWKGIDGKPFYINHETRKAQLENPRKFMNALLGCVTKIPYPEDIDAKITLFYQQIHSTSSYDKSEEDLFLIGVNRSSILQDSYHILMESNAEKDLKRVLNVYFENETMLDVGENAAKEWFSLLSNEISDPRNELLQYVDEDNYESEINAKGKDLTYFKFFGRVVGAAVYHQIVLNVYFVKPYYQVILRNPIELEDVKAADPIYYKNLLITETSELKDHVPEYDDTVSKTKTQLIQEIVENKYVTAVQDQMSAFLEGFNDLIPVHLLRIFTADELKLFIGGIQKIDVDDWKKHTEYDEELESETEVQIIQWFWDILSTFSNDERQKFLKFATGTSRVPAGGFRNLQPTFTIEWNNKNAPNLIPRASICLNTIYLSHFTSEEEMKIQMKKAITKDFLFQGD